MADQQITCATCGRRFTWSAGEQQFYRQRGLQTPRRCSACRSGGRSEATRPARAAGEHPARTRPRPLSRPPTPRRAFGAATLVAALALGVGLYALVPSTPLLAWLIAVNLVALLTYSYDKSIAGGTRMRVPEVVLLGLALVGGSAGAFASMVLLRHKTSKPAFLVPFVTIVAVQIVALVIWLLGRG